MDPDRKDRPTTPVPRNMPKDLEVCEADVDAVPTLSIEARRAKVWDFKVRGLSVSAIARAFGVTEKTIYSDIAAIGEFYRDQLVKSDAVTLLAENLCWLEEMERVALYEVSQADTQVLKTKDHKTGEVTEQRLPDPNKGKFFQAALKAREIRLRTLLDTGVLPKNKVELFEKLEGYQDKADSDSTDERSDNEVKESIQRLLKHGRMMLSAGEVQDA